MSKASFVPENPAEGAGFSSSDLRNNYQALYQLDLNVLRPRAKVPPSMSIGIAGTLIESYYDNVYFTSGDDWATRMSIASGDYAFTKPVTNPRIDIIGLNRSNQFAIASGIESASPSPPAISGDIIPICEVYHKTTETKIVNYENRGSYPNEGYIRKDIRPFLYQKIYGKSGILYTQFSADVKERIIKGWIHFDGTGTIVIRDSYNVSSIQDIGVGNYVIWWDTDFANRYYSAVGMTVSVNVAGIGNIYEGYFTLVIYTLAGVNIDPNVVCLIAIGDQ